MPRCSGVCAPLLRSSRAYASRFPSRYFCSVAPPRAQASWPGDGGQSRIDAEHSALIDPDSLRNTLDAIRSANRTRLIRKIDQDGASRRLSLPDILHVPVKALSADASIIERSSRRRKRTKPTQNAKPPPRLQQVQKKRKIDTGRSATAGQAPPLTPEWELSGTPSQYRTPWLSLVDPPLWDKQSSRSRLSAEMIAFSTYFTPSAAEQTAVAEVLGDLERVCSTQNPPWKVELIGSRSTGLASALSDVDVNIVVEGEQRPDVETGRSKSLLLLRTLARKLRRSGSGAEGRTLPAFTPPTVVARARVPIVIAHHLPTGLELQVQHGNQAYNTTEYTKAFLREYPNLQTLFQVLRQTFALRGLGHGAHGGLSSYALLHLIVFSLRSHEARGGSDDIADQLLHFLDLVSETNFGSTGVIVNPFQLVARGNDLPQDNQGYSMYLEDAADPTNILGRSTSRIRDVQSLVVTLRTQLVAAMKAWDTQSKAWPGASDLRTSARSILESMIGGNYRMFQLNRATLTRERKGESE